MRLIVAIAAVLIVSSVTNAQQRVVCANGQCTTVQVAPVAFYDNAPRIASVPKLAGTCGVSVSGTEYQTAGAETCSTSSSGTRKGLFARIRERRSGGCR